MFFAIRNPEAVTTGQENHRTLKAYKTNVFIVPQIDRVEPFIFLHSYQLFYPQPGSDEIPRWGVGCGEADALLCSSNPPLQRGRGHHIPCQRGGIPKAIQP